MFQFDRSKFGNVPGPGETVDASSLTLSQLVALIWRERLWALVGAAAFVVAAIVFSVLVKPSYEASAQVYIDPQDLQLLQNDITPKPPAGDSGAMFIESQARIMGSPSVLREVVNKLGLATDPEFAAKGGGSSGLSGPEAAMQGTLDLLAGAVHVVRADRTYVVEIYARSEDPQKAARIANAVVAAYLALRETQRVGQAAQATDSIAGRLEQLRLDLTAKDQAVDRFKVANGLVATSSGSLIESRLAEANTAVSTTQRAMDQAKAHLDQLDLAGKDPAVFLSSPEATASADLVRLRGEFDQAQADLKTLGATLGPRHPSVIKAQTQLDAVSRSITAAMERIRTGARLEFNNARADHDAALAALKSLTLTFQDSDNALVQLHQLERDADSSRTVYEDALLRSRQTHEQAQVNTANVQVISPATAPVQKRFPPRLTILIPLALIFGLAAGIAVGLLSRIISPSPGAGRQQAGGKREAVPATLLAEPVMNTPGSRHYTALPKRGDGGHAG